MNIEGSHKSKTFIRSLILLHQNVRGAEVLLKDKSNLFLATNKRLKPTKCPVTPQKLGEAQIRNFPARKKASYSKFILAISASRRCDLLCKV